ncbi:hypothetical protein NPIL_97051 [Nephila pilipes]|uniref:Uncharacterized protein n=1 Tax=Nephila pilipes TaxID=299642 RepID=A0A8X6PZJ7_NEPPI|nr:hypothetical protein NPIL_97051 [Nephila pilipes]
MVTVVQCLKLRKIIAADERWGHHSSHQKHEHEMAKPFIPMTEEGSLFNWSCYSHFNVLLQCRWPSIVGYGCLWARLTMLQRAVLYCMN